MVVNENATILKVTRRGGGKSDGYGQPRLDTVYDEVGCRIEFRKSVEVGADGQSVTIDAEVDVNSNYEFLPGDTLILRGTPARTFLVMDSTDAMDVSGVSMWRSYRLVEQRKKIG